MATLSNLGALINFKLAQGATWQNDFKWIDKTNNTPINLAGYTAKLEIRNKPGGNVLYHTSSTANGEITLDEQNGIFKIEIPAVATEAFNFKVAHYDFEAYSGSRVYRIAQGSVELNKEVTK